MNRKTFLKLAAAAPFLPLLSIGKEAGRVETIRVSPFCVCINEPEGTKCCYFPHGIGATVLEIFSKFNGEIHIRFPKWIVESPLIRVKAVIFGAPYSDPVNSRRVLDITIHHY